MSSEKSSFKTRYRFMAFVMKEFAHVLRDRRTLLILFGMPVVLILIFGFALTNEVKNSRILVIDQAQDAYSRQLTARLEASHYFDIEVSSRNPEDIDKIFKQGRIRLVVVFPDQFTSQLLRQNHTALQVIADASDPNTAGTLTTYITRIVDHFMTELNSFRASPLRIVPQVRMLYNPQLKGTPNFVPGVIALVLMLVCVLMTAVSIVKEKETGTMEILLVSPFNPLLVIFSKALPYLILSLLNVASIVLLSIFVLDLPVNGSMLLLFAESTLFIITCLSLGILISVRTQSQQAAMMISFIGMMLPSLLFSGFMFPVENMPMPLQYISNVIPSRWYYIIMKAIMIKGVGFSYIWKETLILAISSVVFIGISLKSFKIRLA